MRTDRARAATAARLQNPYTLFLGRKEEPGILLSYQERRKTFRLKPNSSTFILGPEGTLVGVRRGQGMMSVEQRFPPPIAVFFAKQLRVGENIRHQELLFTRTALAEITVEVVSEQTPPQFEKPDLADINPRNYEELHRVAKLKHGDILPGSRFVLGRPETYGTGTEFSDFIRREIAILNFSASSRAAGLYALAERLRQTLPLGSLAERISAVDMISNLVFTFTPIKPEIKGRTGAVVSVGELAVSAPECRHRAGLQNKMLNTVELVNWPTRGILKQYNYPHAWNTVDILRDASFCYFSDSSLFLRGRSDLDLAEDHSHPYPLQLTMTRRELRKNFQADKTINTVWRPRRRYG